MMGHMGAVIVHIYCHCFPSPTFASSPSCSGLDNPRLFSLNSIGRTNVIKRGHFWLGVDQRERQSSKGADCDILTQGLIGLIE
jgi:hypothetical protein